MRRTSESQPVLSFCLIVRNAEKSPSGKPYLEPCLRSIRERAPDAEIVIVETGGSIDRTAEIAQDYADVYELWKGPRGDWDALMPAFDDAAVARQRSFDLASGRWIGWIDADDRLPGPEEAKELLQHNGQWCPPTRAGAKKLEDPGAGEPLGLVELLAWLDENHPEIDMIWCPYLYERTADGEGVVWQMRERFVKRKNGALPFVWREAAHEVLVPVPGHVPRRLDLPHLLFVHEKEFSPDEVEYNLRRHFNLLLEQYDAGDRTTRRCLYLAAQAQTLCPEREEEFLEAAKRSAVTPTDRMRCLIHEGIYLARRGFYWDAVAVLSGAIAMRPDLPDGYLALADQAVRFEDWGRAAEALQEGLGRAYDQAESYVPARAYAVHYPAALARLEAKIGDEFVRAGKNREAAEHYAEATAWARRLAESDAVQKDRCAAHYLLAEIENREQAHLHAMAIAGLVEYLLDNDEPLKALKLLEAIPWRLEDHPIVMGLELRLRQVVEHVRSPEKYVKFYLDEDATGMTRTPSEWFDMKPATGSFRFGRPPSRGEWIPNWIRERIPSSDILEIGCFDGFPAIPILQRCSDVSYYAMDIQEKALAWFRENLAERGLTDRVWIEVGAEVEAAFPSKRLFDAIVWTEVIEHVPEPVRELVKISKRLKPSGYLFVTTPRGAYDDGHPPKPRDSRGHLRAFTPWELVRTFDAASECSDLGWRVEALWSDHSERGMNLVARKERPSSSPKIRFVVPSALWDWNGLTIHLEGMGASETQIVYLAEAFAKTDEVEVYGPVPEPCVHKFVRYWEREKIRHLPKGEPGKLIVSRAPSSYALFADDLMGHRMPKILWLQDVWYPDLTLEVADQYEAIVCVSEWHKGVIQEALKQWDGADTRIHAISNALVPEEWNVEPQERKADRFIYVSSPDRGLTRVLECWPRVLKALPDAELHVFYGWRGCQKLGVKNSWDANWMQRYETTRRNVERLRHQKGVFFHDMVPKSRLVVEFLKSGVWVHPSLSDDGTRFAETNCTSALEARAGGCIPVCAPHAGLLETAKCPETIYAEPEDIETFADAMIAATEVSPDDPRRKSMSEQALTDFSIYRFLPIWRSLIDA